MSSNTKSDFVPGDLVYVDMAGLWTLDPGPPYPAVVAAVEENMEWMTRWSASRVPVVPAHAPGRVHWVSPSRLELVQRGGQ